MNVPGIASKVVRLAADILDGAATPGSVARTLVGIGLDVVPVEELRGHLDAAAVARAEAAADAAEAIKFGR